MSDADAHVLTQYLEYEKKQRTHKHRDKGRTPPKSNEKLLTPIGGVSSRSTSALLEDVSTALCVRCVR